MIRTTNDTMRTLLFQASLPAHFWAESLHTSTYLLNRLPSVACPAPTPHHALFGTPPRYDHLRVFGCACYPNTTATAPHKLAPRSTQCVFLGYSPDHKGYRCFDLTSRRILISRHVVFDESVFPFSTTSPPPSTPDLDLFSLFPTDTVDQPPLTLCPAGTTPPCPSPARRPPVRPLTLRPARVQRRRTPVLLLALRPARVRRPRLQHLLRVSHSRCVSTTAECGRLRCIWSRPRHHRRRLGHHRWPLLRRRHLRRHLRPRLPVSRSGCTTRLSCTVSRVMFTLW